MIGIIVNLICGLLIIFLGKKLFDWLPNRTQLQNRFQKVAQVKSAHEKIVQLTPLVFIAFFWLFVGNMVWAFSNVLFEILSWPDTIVWMHTEEYYKSTESFIATLKSEMAGLIVSRWILWLCISLFVIACYWKGIAIAKQCWEVYKELDA